jgi:serine/threonine protein kinase
VITDGRMLLEALATAHRQGIVQRDIKPANVLFDRVGRPALSDFGVAVAREFTMGLMVAGSVTGTPGFLAPEQARGEATSPASDVFSLGATLAYALTGQGPFGVGDPMTLVARDRVARRDGGHGQPGPRRRRRLVFDPCWRQPA